MTPQELEAAIRDIIRNTYRKEYVGKMTCIPLCGTEGWTVVLGMNQVEKPITISAQLPDDKFLKFFRQELLDRNWNTIKWFSGYKRYPDDNECPISKSCKCND